MPKNFAVVESKFTYKGHECICIFTHWGYRCGYVSVSNEGDYEDFDIACHGGLTFSGDLLDMGYGPSKPFFIGFDCGHYGDGCDLDMALRYGLIDVRERDMRKELDLFPDCGVMRSLEYVKDQCKSIVDQLEQDV